VRLTRLFSLTFLFLWLIVASLPTAAQSDSTADEAAIRALVERMADTVINQDAEAYLSLVDLSDPIFASEHTYLVNDWAESEPLDKFGIKIDAITIEGDTASADLQITWIAEINTSYRRATLPVRFVRETNGEWRYAGEAWTTLETDHFRVRALPGMERSARRLIRALPDIYEHVTTSLDYVPEAVIEIKLYDSSDSLVATTALRLPPISGWNEPGESLKMVVEPGTVPSAAVLAHEMAHFVTFDMAGTTHGHYPWWLSEGVSEYIASAYWDPERSERILAWASEASADGTLADWNAMSDYETTPLDLWPYVYPQGYAFVAYISEVFGDTARNDWLWAMAGDLWIDSASPEVFDMTFEELEQGFLDWLAER
jgi:hypothetical protein